MKLIITSGYYSPHDVEGILEIPDEKYPLVKKLVKSFVTDIEKEIPMDTVENWYDKKEEYQKSVFSWLGDFDPYPPKKITVLKRILERNKIPYTFETYEKLSLGDYWGGY